MFLTPQTQLQNELNLPCKCERCLDEARSSGVINQFRSLFHACKLCGNKRCPKQEWHKYKCTKSNEPNQICELEDDV